MNTDITMKSYFSRFFPSQGELRDSFLHVSNIARFRYIYRQYRIGGVFRYLYDIDPIISAAIEADIASLTNIDDIATVTWKWNTYVKCP